MFTDQRLIQALQTELLRSSDASGRRRPRSTAPAPTDDDAQTPLRTRLAHAFMRSVATPTAVLPPARVDLGTEVLLP
jgi:hypothetical protein